MSTSSASQIIRAKLKAMLPDSVPASYAGSGPDVSNVVIIELLSQILSILQQQTGIQPVRSNIQP